MPRDLGDRNPSDIGDVKPAAPTVNYSETNTKRLGSLDPRITVQNTGFDSTYRADEQFQPVRHAWIGTILDELSDNNYEILLQNGEEVIAKDLYAVNNYHYIEAQTVVVITGQRGNEYWIVGQKFNTSGAIEYVSLTEILDVGGMATGVQMLSLGANGWAKLQDEITVYDSFYQNYGLAGEVFSYNYNVSTQTATFVGSQGLIRLGKTTENINPDARGGVQVYDSTGAVANATIDAALTWMHNNQAIPNDTEVIIKWFIEHDDWIIIGKEC